MTTRELIMRRRLAQSGRAGQRLSEAALRGWLCELASAGYLVESEPDTFALTHEGLLRFGCLAEIDLEEAA